MTELLLIGAGGHCKVVIDAILNLKNFKVAGIIDLPQKAGENIYGIPVIGTDMELDRFYRQGIRHCHVSVGSIGSPALRVKLCKQATSAGFAFSTIISRHAVVSEKSIIGEGTFVAPGAVINAGAKVGSNCIINTGAVIDHDCVIGDFTHIAPRAVLGGGVTVGEFSHIGAGSSLMQYITIGKGTIIGMGSVVTKSFGDNLTAFGCPCVIRKNNE
ncbi:MAG: hypothetical protein A2219_00325 [Elusimicrobia bacterium RIFOXYA2_FULL_50_26]|nr:MAG: hypothetical protein A2219_00325 [Elusimicrobia bacterium RIFOXYA2_FULL_50_26]